MGSATKGLSINDVLSKGKGRGGVKNVRIYLVKRRQRGREAGRQGGREAGRS